MATLGWLFDSMDQQLFVLARTPALRQLLPGIDEAELGSYAGYATSIFIVDWASGALVFGLFGDRWGRTLPGIHRPGPHRFRRTIAFPPSG